MRLRIDNMTLRVILTEAYLTLERKLTPPLSPQDIGQLRGLRKVCGRTGDELTDLIAEWLNTLRTEDSEYKSQCAARNQVAARRSSEVETPSAAERLRADDDF